MQLRALMENTVTPFARLAVYGGLLLVGMVSLSLLVGMGCLGGALGTPCQSHLQCTPGSFCEPEFIDPNGPGRCRVGCLIDTPNCPVQRFCSPTDPSRGLGQCSSIECDSVFDCPVDTTCWSVLKGGGSRTVCKRIIPCSGEGAADDCAHNTGGLSCRMVDFVDPNGNVDQTFSCVPS